MQHPIEATLSRRESISTGLARRVVAILLMAVVVSGCSDPTVEKDPGAGDSLQQLELNDATGRRVQLSRPASRVVSFAPNLTEILFAIGAGDITIGRSAFCNYPAAAERLPVVTDLSTPNYERLLQLRPDLLLMTFVGNSSAAYEKLVELGMRPYAISAATIEGTLGAIDTVGRLVGRVDQAHTLVSTLRRTLDSVRALATSRPVVSAFIVLDRAPLMTVSGGFINEAIELAGGRNIAAGDPTTYPRYSREEVLRRDPEVIIVPGESPVSAASLLESFPEWSRLRAIRNGRVRTISPDILFRPGPRLGHSVALLYSALHSSEPAR